MIIADKFTLCLRILSLLIICSLGKSDAVHSLSYNFIIIYQRLGQRWCEVEGQFNEKPFLYYDSGKNQFQSIDSMGDEINATKVWEEQVETLRDVKDELTQQLTDIMSELYAVKFPFSLQGRMTCQRNANGLTLGSWKFNFNGQLDLLFDSEKTIWTNVNPGGKLMKEKWEKDKDIIMFFKNTSMGHCKRWLKNFLVLWNKELETKELPSMTPTTRIYIITVKNSTDCGIGTYITKIILGILAFALAEAFLILVFIAAVYLRDDFIFDRRLINPEDAVE